MLKGCHVDKYFRSPNRDSPIFGALVETVTTTNSFLKSTSFEQVGCPDSFQM